MDASPECLKPSSHARSLQAIWAACRQDGSLSKISQRIRSIRKCRTRTGCLQGPSRPSSMTFSSALPAPSRLRFSSLTNETLAHSTACQSRFGTGHPEATAEVVEALPGRLGLGPSFATEGRRCGAQPAADSGRRTCKCCEAHLGALYLPRQSVAGTFDA